MDTSPGVGGERERRIVWCRSRDEREDGDDQDPRKLSKREAERDNMKLRPSNNQAQLGWLLVHLPCLRDLNRQMKSFYSQTCALGRGFCLFFAANLTPTLDNGGQRWTKPSIFTHHDFVWQLPRPFFFYKNRTRGVGKKHEYAAVRLWL